MALAEFLAENRHLQRLDLRQNQVRLGGLMALSLALRINRSLACLDVEPTAPQEQVGGKRCLTHVQHTSAEFGLVVEVAGLGRQRWKRSL